MSNHVKMIYREGFKIWTNCNVSLEAHIGKAYANMKNKIQFYNNIDF